MNTYYKITNENEKHNGYQYIDGLNILNEPFNDDINDACGKGGLYFTNNENIINFLNYGVNLRVVQLPTGNPNFRMVGFKNKYRANMIILKEKYKFNVLEDVKEILKINSKFIDYILTQAFEQKNEEIINWIITTNYVILEHNIFNRACNSGYFNILNWMVKNNYEISYFHNDGCVLNAALHGNVKILEWFRCHNYCFKNSNILKYASENGDVNILDWIKKNRFIPNLEDLYDPMFQACKNGHIHVLEWFINNNDEIKLYDMDESAYMNLKILEWLKNNNYEIPTKCVKYAYDNNKIEISEWFNNNHYDIKWHGKSDESIFMHIEILQYHSINGLEIPKTCAIYAFEHNKIEILEWLKNNMNLKFYYDKNKKYNSNALTIQWLKNNADNMDNVVLF